MALSRRARRLATGLWVGVMGLAIVGSVTASQQTGGLTDPVACVRPLTLMALAVLPPGVIAEVAGEKLGIDIGE